ncbi:hypothetical protein Taro_045297, partial [Colocasia esculenta]|nr:hypothetical protein [Colocasia esculenta]
STPTFAGVDFSSSRVDSFTIWRSTRVEQKDRLFKGGRLPYNLGVDSEKLRTVRVDSFIRLGSTLVLQQGRLLKEGRLPYRAGVDSENLSTVGVDSFINLGSTPLTRNQLRLL